MVHPSAARLCGVRWQQVLIVGVHAAPTPTPTPPANPCAWPVAQAETEEEEPTAEAEAYADSKRLPRLDSDPRWSVLNSLWLHAAAGRFALPLAETGTHSQDVGNVAVLQDPGDIIVSANQFDLQNLNLKFTRSGSSYDVTRTTNGFRSALGNRITLSDDDTSRVHGAVHVLVLRQGPDAGVPQLGRQHHVRAGRHREHRPQRLAVPDRAAARARRSSRISIRPPAAAGCSWRPGPTARRSPGATSVRSRRRRLSARRPCSCPTAAWNTTMRPTWASRTRSSASPPGTRDNSSRWT